MTGSTFNTPGGSLGEGAKPLWANLRVIWHAMHPRPGAADQAKSTLGAPSIDLFMHFIEFWPCRKIVVFPMAFWAVQKSKKSSFGVPKGRQTRFEYSPGVSRSGGRGPRTVRKKDRLAARRSRRDPDTPLGRRPGEYSYTPGCFEGELRSEYNVPPWIYSPTSVVVGFGNDGKFSSVGFGLVLLFFASCMGFTTFRSMPEIDKSVGAVQAACECIFNEADPEDKCCPPSTVCCFSMCSQLLREAFLKAIAIILQFIFCGVGLLFIVSVGYVGLNWFVNTCSFPICGVPQPIFKEWSNIYPPPKKQ